jgi:hypothetical protein
VLCADDDELVSQKEKKELKKVIETPCVRRIMFLIQEFFDQESNCNCTVIIIFFVTEYATPVIYQCILITAIGCDSAAAPATSNGAFFQKQFDIQMIMSPCDFSKI